MYYRFIKVSGLYGIASPYPAILYGRGDLRNTLCLNGHAGRQKPAEKVKNYVELPRSHGMTVSHQREPGRELEQDGSSEQWEETSNATLQALFGSKPLQFLPSYGFQLLGFRLPRCLWGFWLARVHSKGLPLLYPVIRMSIRLGFDQSSFDQSDCEK